MTRRAAPAVEHTPSEGTQWEQVVELIGDQAAAHLSKDFGGRRIYIPRSPGPSHPLTVSIGAEKAQILAAGMAGEDLEPPLSSGRRLRIVALLRQGLKPEHISRQLGCSRRYVFKVRKELDGEGNETGGASDQLTLI